MAEPMIVMGLMWYDDEGTMPQRVLRVIDHYREKYGEPALVLVSKKNEPDDPHLIGAIAVPTRFHGALLKNHIWVGPIDENEG